MNSGFNKYTENHIFLSMKNIKEVLFKYLLEELSCKQVDELCKIFQSDIKRAIKSKEKRIKDESQAAKTDKKLCSVCKKFLPRYFFDNQSARCRSCNYLQEVKNANK